MKYIYEIVNLINGKTYYGQRTLPKGRTMEGDYYWGSGKLITAAFKKYGQENFKKNILCYGDFDQQQIDQYEKCIIRMMRAVGKAEYNIANGGLWGFPWSLVPKESLSAGQKRRFNKIEEREKVSKRIKNLWKTEGYKEKHRESQKNGKPNKSIGSKGKHWKCPEGHSKGEKNSQFGTHWYTNGQESIKAIECPKGYWSGKISYQTGLYYFNNGIIEVVRSECPEGFNNGKLTGKHWYTNGVNNKQCKECPEGYWLGHSEYIREHWWTNGVDNVYSKECPEGFKRGKKLQWYTNGIINRQCMKCPEGFRRGKIRIKNKIT
jgi:hypothetical protein